MSYKHQYVFPGHSRNVHEGPGHQRDLLPAARYEHAGLQVIFVSFLLFFGKKYFQGEYFMHWNISSQGPHPSRVIASLALLLRNVRRRLHQTLVFLVLNRAGSITITKESQLQVFGRF